MCKIKVAIASGLVLGFMMALLFAVDPPDNRPDNLTKQDQTFLDGLQKGYE